MGVAPVSWKQLKGDLLLEIERASKPNVEWIRCRLYQTSMYSKIVVRACNREGNRAVTHSAFRVLKKLSMTALS